MIQTTGVELLSSLSKTRNWKGKLKGSLGLSTKECTSFCILTLTVNWISCLMQQQNSQIRRVKNQKNYGVCEDNHLKYMYCLSASYNPSSIITPQPLRFSYFETNSLSLSI